MAWRKATAAGTTSGTWTNANRLIVMVFRGDQTIAVNGSAILDGTGTAVDTPPVTFDNSLDSYVVGLIGHKTATTMTTPAGVTRFRTFSTNPIVTGDRTTAAQSSWAGTAATADTSAAWHAVTVAVFDGPATIQGAAATISGSAVESGTPTHSGPATVNSPSVVGGGTPVALSSMIATWSGNGGVDNTNITQFNSGASPGTAFTDLAVGDGTFTFTTICAHGTYGMRVAQGPTQSQLIGWGPAALGTLNASYWRFMIRLSGTPTTSQGIVRFKQAGGATEYVLRLDISGGTTSPGRWRIRNSAGVQIAELSTGMTLHTWYRVELDVVHSTGRVVLRLYEGDSTTLVATSGVLLGQAIGESISTVHIGALFPTPQMPVYYLDDLAVNNASNPGAVTVFVPPPAKGAFTGWGAAAVIVDGTRAGRKPATIEDIKRVRGVNWYGMDDGLRGPTLAELRAFVAQGFNFLRLPLRDNTSHAAVAAILEDAVTAGIWIGAERHTYGKVGGVVISDANKQDWYDKTVADAMAWQVYPSYVALDLNEPVQNAAVWEPISAGRVAALRAAGFTGIIGVCAALASSSGGINTIHPDGWWIDDPNAFIELHHYLPQLTDGYHQSRLELDNWARDFSGQGVTTYLAYVNKAWAFGALGTARWADVPIFIGEYGFPQALDLEEDAYLTKLDGRAQPVGAIRWAVGMWSGNYPYKPTATQLAILSNHTDYQ